MTATTTHAHAHHHHHSEPPAPAQPPARVADALAELRVTDAELRLRVARWLACRPRGATRAAVGRGVHGARRERVLRALDGLVRDGIVRCVERARSHGAPGVTRRYALAWPHPPVLLPLPARQLALQLAAAGTPSATTWGTRAEVLALLAARPDTLGPLTVAELCAALPHRSRAAIDAALARLGRAGLAVRCWRGAYVLGLPAAAGAAGAPRAATTTTTTTTTTSAATA